MSPYDPFPPGTAPFRAAAVEAARINARKAADGAVTLYPLPWSRERHELMLDALAAAMAGEWPVDAGPFLDVAPLVIVEARKAFNGRIAEIAGTLAVGGNA